MEVNQNMIRMTCFNPTNHFQNFIQKAEVTQTEKQHQELHNQLSSDIQKSKKRLQSDKRKENKQPVSLMQQIQKPETCNFIKKEENVNLMGIYDDLEEENVSNYKQPKQRKISPTKQIEVKPLQNQAPNTNEQYLPPLAVQHKYSQEKQSLESLQKQLEESLKVNESLIEEENRNKQKIQQEFQNIHKSVQEYLQKHKFVERSQYNNLVNQFEKLNKENEDCTKKLEEQQKLLQDYEQVQRQYNPFMNQMLNILKGMKAIDSIQCIQEKAANGQQEDIQKYLMKIQYKRYYFEFTLTLSNKIVTYELVKTNQTLQFSNILGEPQQFAEQDLNQFAQYVVDQVIGWNQF